MNLSDFEVKIEWPNDVNKDIVWSQLTPYTLPPSTEFDHKAFYHQAALAKPVPPKPINFTFELSQDADIYNYLKSFFTSKKYYGLYSLKDKGWVHIHNKMVYARSKKVLWKKYVKMVNNFLIPLSLNHKDILNKYLHDKNIVIKPFWL